MKQHCSVNTKEGAGPACRNWAIRWDGAAPEWYVPACSSHFVAANNYYTIQKRKRLVQLEEVMKELGLDSGLAGALFNAMERRVGWFQ